MAKSIVEFEGVVIGDRELAPAIDRAAENADFLHGRSTAEKVFADAGRSLGFAAAASIASVNALMAAASAQCSIGGSPVAIDMVVEGSDLIYRCRHSSPHRWRLDGKTLP